MRHFYHSTWSNWHALAAPVFWFDNRARIRCTGAGADPTTKSLCLDTTSSFAAPTRSISLLQQNTVTTIETCCIIHGKMCCNINIATSGILLHQIVATRVHRCNDLLQHERTVARICCNTGEILLFIYSHNVNRIGTYICRTTTTREGGG